jgi:hypothetical protein
MMQAGEERARKPPTVALSVLDQSPWREVTPPPAAEEGESPPLSWTAADVV